MVSISLCMIVKDEEKTIGRALGSIGEVVDEIIIVDTGSKDKTKDICKSFGAKIYDFKWVNDFGLARNYSFSKATKDYIFWLDGDDYIDEENIIRLKKLKEELTLDIHSVLMDYSLSRNENNETIFSVKRNRLVKRDRNFKWVGKVHEYLEVFGKIIDSNIVIIHSKEKERSNRNLLIFKEMEDKKEEFTTRDILYYGNELYDNSLYLEAVNKYKELLKREDIWEEDGSRVLYNLGRSLQFLGESTDKILSEIFEGLKRFTPNGELLCLIGDCFMEKKMYREGIIYYKSALNLDIYNKSFYNKPYVRWIPAIELCVAYSKLSNFKKAYYYNELARIYGGPKDKIKHNKLYLEDVMKKNNITIEDIRETIIWD